MINLEKVKGYDSLTARRKEIFKEVFVMHNACYENPKNKEAMTPVKVENDEHGVKVTFKNKVWLHYYANGTWG
jgi:hypothetical protein